MAVDKSLREAALKLLERRWVEHMDDTGIEAFQFTAGLASMAYSLGFLEEGEVSDYLRRIRTCPVGNGKHTDGRGWCAYCGTLRVCALCGKEVPARSLESVKKENIWFCNLKCRGAYLAGTPVEDIARAAAVEAVRSGRYVFRVLCRVCHKAYECETGAEMSQVNQYGYCSDECADASVAYMKQSEMTR